MTTDEALAEAVAVCLGRSRSEKAAEAAGLLSRLRPFVEAAMRYAPVLDAHDSFARECRADFLAAYRALVVEPVETK
jgi:hypothetical protein